MTREPRLRAFVSVGVGVLLALLFVTPVAAAGNGTSVKVIVTFKHGGSGTSAAEAKRTIESVGGHQTRKFKLIDASAATVPSNRLAKLRAQPNVKSVELDAKLTALADPELDAAWGVKHIGAGAVHSAGNTGQGIKVGIIDTGIDYTHPDLDGVYAGGYDFFNNDQDPFDDNGHGTHVAGILAAEMNGQGVVGVAPGARVYSYKVLGADGSGDYSDMIAALDRASLVDHVAVVNMSLGGSTPSTALADAVGAAYAQGTILVAASGNVSNFYQLLFGCPVVYPAAYPQVFATTFTNQNDALTGYSCTGPEVDFAAPGDLIYSTVPTGSCMYCDPSGYRGDLSGTSMASPHLAGTVALVLAHGIQNQGDLSTLADDVKAHLCATAAQGYGVNSTAISPTDPRYAQYFGCGVVDAENALITNPPPGGGPPPVNQPPVAVDDSASTNQDTAVDISVLANDSDPDGDTLTIDSVTSPANGAATINGSKVHYVPAAGYTGSDSFGYTISDGQGHTASANVTVTVNAPPVNQPPVAVDDSATTDQDVAVDIAVLANDSDPDGDPLTIDSVGSAGHGTTSINGNKVHYTPDTGFNGSDSFGYTISDGQGHTASANVAVTVNAPPVNQPPVANDDSATTQQDTAVDIAVLANDSDPEGDQLTIESVGSAGHGTATVNGSNVHYVPAAGFTGSDSFGYTISDGQGNTASANVAVTVNAPPSVHVSDIDALTSKNSKNWSLRVRIYVASETGGVLQNVVVNGIWGTGLVQSCTSNRFSYCEVSVVGIKKNVPSMTFTVTSLVATDRVYLPSANTDPDGDSDGTTIVVYQP